MRATEFKRDRFGWYAALNFILLGKTVAMSSFKILILAWVKFNDSAYALQKVRDQNEILHRFAMKFHAGLCAISRIFVVEFHAARVKFYSRNENGI